MKKFQIKTLICNFRFLDQKFSHFYISWWIMTLGTWFWPKSQSLTFQCTIDFWSVDWKIYLSIQCIWDLLSLVIRLIWCHWVLETMLEPNLPLARWKIRNCPSIVKNPNFDHFAFLMIWSNFLRSCGPNLIKWFIWVYNVDVDQKLWGLTVNWPQLTFSPIQLIFRSTVQLTGQKFDSRLETWYGQS